MSFVSKINNETIIVDDKNLKEQKVEEKPIEIFSNNSQQVSDTTSKDTLFNYTDEDESMFGFTKSSQTPPSQTDEPETPQKPTSASYKPNENAKELTLTYGETEDGEIYTNAVVQEGETPTTIANTFDVDEVALKSMNSSVIHKMKSNNYEYFIVGENIKIPREIVPNAENYETLVNRKDPKGAVKDYYNSTYADTEPYNGPTTTYQIQKNDNYYNIALNTLQESGSRIEITEQIISDRMLQIQKLNDNKPFVVGNEIIVPSNNPEDIFNDAQERFNILYDALKDNINPQKITQTIKGITPQTAELIFAAYDKYSKTNLVVDLLNSEHLSNKEKQMCIKHFVKEIEQQAKDKDKLSSDVMKNLYPLANGYSDKTSHEDILRMGADVRKLVIRQDTISQTVPRTNGLIDENFKQGNTGDCWLLSGINSMVSTPEGRQLVNESIKLDKNGNYEITLKGVNKTYTVTPQELKGSNNLSTGDGDLRAVEIAVDKYFREAVPQGRPDIKGNTCGKAFELFTDKPVKTAQSSEDRTNFLNDIQKNKNNIAAVTGASQKIPKDINATVNGEKVKIYSSHAYTILNVDDKNVYLINPHDTKNTITMNKEDYLKYFDLLSTIEF